MGVSVFIPRGSSSIEDTDDKDDNLKIKDLNFTFEFRNSVYLFSVYAYQSKNLLRLNMQWQRSSPKEDWARLRLSRFTLSKIRIKVWWFHAVLSQKTVKKPCQESLKTHMPKHCAAHYAFCLVPFPLASPSWFAKAPFKLPHYNFMQQNATLVVAAKITTNLPLTIRKLTHQRGKHCL